MRAVVTVRRCGVVELHEVVRLTKHLRRFAEHLAPDEQLDGRALVGRATQVRPVRLERLADAKALHGGHLQPIPDLDPAPRRRSSDLRLETVDFLRGKITGNHFSRFKI